MTVKRYCEKDFPEYAHRPGKTVHPNKEGGHSYQKAEPEEKAVHFDDYQNHIEYLFGIDLYNHGFFWEAHVYWEACWNGNGRQGDIADFLKALILLSAGRLKLEIGQLRPAKGHWDRAIELFEPIPHREFLGIDLNSLVAQIEEFSSEIEAKGTLHHKIVLD